MAVRSHKSRLLTRWIIFSGPCLILAVSIFWLFHRPGFENVQPDYFEFGSMARGSTVEFSALFLAGGNPSPIEKHYDHWQSKSTGRTSDWLQKINPDKLRKLFHEMSAEELNNLKPKIIAPDGISIISVEARQDHSHFLGEPFFIVSFSLHPEVAGDFREKISLQWKGRRSDFQIKARVHEESELASSRVLFTETPFEALASSSPKSFEPLTGLTSEPLIAADFCFHIPDEDLSQYDVILIGESMTLGLSNDINQRLKTYVDGGGRLILTGNAFYPGSVPKMNELIKVFTPSWDKAIKNSDRGQKTFRCSPIQDPMTSGISQLSFRRASEIKKPPTPAWKILASVDDTEGGFIAIWRGENGGELVLLTQSLWWNWIGDNPQNEKFMKGLLIRRG